MTSNTRVAVSTVWGAFLALGVMALSEGAQAQDHMTVWDGVYTSEQAVDGRAHYSASCSGCHDGGDVGAAPGLIDASQFLEKWGEDDLISMFDRIRSTMPAREPGSLSEEAYLDIVAYLLEANGFPAGETELAVDFLPSIRVEAEDGPGPVPDFALVEVVACLSRGAQGQWMATSATEAVRTRDPSRPPPEALQAMAGATLGAGTFELIYVFPDPAAFEGHRIEVKGFLMREPDPDRINVSNLSSIARACP